MNFTMNTEAFQVVVIILLGVITTGVWCIFGLLSARFTTGRRGR